MIKQNKYMSFIASLAKTNLISKVAVSSFLLASCAGESLTDEQKAFLDSLKGKTLLTDAEKQEYDALLAKKNDFANKTELANQVISYFNTTEGKTAINLATTSLAFGDYTKTTDLESQYVKKTDLGDYTKTTDLDTKLADYTTTNDLNTKLAGYTKTTDLDTKLADYTTTNDLNTKLAEYTKTTDLDNEYVKKSVAASEYAKKDDLNNIYDNLGDLTNPLMAQSIVDRNNYFVNPFNAFKAAENMSPEALKIIMDASSQRKLKWNLNLNASTKAAIDAVMGKNNNNNQNLLKQDDIIQINNDFYKMTEAYKGVKLNNDGSWDTNAIDFQ